MTAVMYMVLADIVQAENARTILAVLIHAIVSRATRRLLLTAKAPREYILVLRELVTGLDNATIRRIVTDVLRQDATAGGGRAAAAPAARVT